MPHCLFTDMFFDGHTKVSQKPIYLRFSVFQNGIQFVSQSRIFSANSHADVEDERERWRIRWWSDGRQLQRHPRALCQISCERSPRDSDVDISTGASALASHL